MKRRVNIGAALLHKPAVIIMDEPTVGIDPQSRRHILDNVKELNQEGMTVLYTTHYMEEAAELSHHIAIMDQYLRAQRARTLLMQQMEKSPHLWMIRTVFCRVYSMRLPGQVCGFSRWISRNQTLKRYFCI